MDALRSLDAFPKTIDDFRVKTVSGAVGIIIVFIVFIFNHVSNSFHYKYYIDDDILLLRGVIFLKNGN
jgi:uncharacterized membrane protein YdbT with pleckstrin-like domain